MEDNKKYIDIIVKALNGDVSGIELVSETSNIVFKVYTNQYGIVYAKFYLNKSSHLDNELHLYSFMNQKYLKEVIVSSESPKFAIFKELKGKTLDELTVEEIHQNKRKIIDSLVYFYETIGSKRVQGFGLLDETMNGTSKDFKEFIVNRQTETEHILADYSILGTAFSKIYSKYENIITGDNSLVPIDTNAKNIMLTDDGEVKFIDPGELISAPKLMGYGDFVAHTYKTELYDCLMQRLNLSREDERRLRIYAVFSSLNILAFLKKLGVDNLDSVVPYGNTESFYNFIREHLKALEI